jgi:hypothetical protein
MGGRRFERNGDWETRLLWVSFKKALEPQRLSTEL